MKYNLNANATQLTIKSLEHKTPSASLTYRFDDPFLPGAVVPGLAQQLDVLREDEGPGNEAELLLAEANLHLGQVPPQPVLPADLERSREVVQLGRGINGQTDRSECESRRAHLRPVAVCAASSYLLVLPDGLEAWRLHVVSPAAQPVVAFCKKGEDLDQSFNDKRETKLLKLNAKK